MSIRAFINSVREGLIGIIRHPLVTVASVTTILLMLIIMSVFFVFSANARFIMKKIGQQPPVEIYMTLQANESQMQMVEEELQSDSRILNHVKKSPEQNYLDFKSNLGDSSSILDKFDYNMYLPNTYHLQLVDPSYADEIADDYSLFPGVNKVSKESRVMSFLTKARKIVNMGSVLAFAVLFIIALFIISNMVRISVYSRASEIEIMKFVGANNAYIRLPYIIEGALVGMISAALAWGIACVSYHFIYGKAMQTVEITSFYALLPLSSLIWWILLIVLLMGILIGSIGSGISVRKYVKV